MEQRERRSLTEPVSIKTREAGEEGSPVIQGYAALFDVETEIGSCYGAFKESIAPGAFTRTLQENPRVISLYNHDFNYLLGTTASGTLRLMEDMRGLWFEVDPPQNSVGQDLVESVRRGDVNGASFMFTITKEEWTVAQSKEDFDRRRILEVDLIECGPVSLPAYSQTSVGLRSEASDEAHARAREEWERSNQPEEPIVIVHPEPYLLKVRALRLAL